MSCMKSRAVSELGDSHLLMERVCLETLLPSVALSQMEENTEINAFHYKNT